MWRLVKIFEKKIKALFPFRYIFLLYIVNVVSELSAAKKKLKKKKFGTEKKKQKIIVYIEL